MAELFLDRLQRQAAVVQRSAISACGDNAILMFRFSFPLYEYDLSILHAILFT